MCIYLVRLVFLVILTVYTQCALVVRHICTSSTFQFVRVFTLLIWQIPQQGWCSV